MNEGKCADCGFAPQPMSVEVWKRGSKVREPGEYLCNGCSSRRVLMVRAVDALPKSLDLIKAGRLNVSPR